MSTLNASRFSFLALLSAILGLFCVTGPFAVFLGWIAVRAINSSDGRLRGAGLAIFGLVAGGIGTAIIGVGTVAMVIQNAREKSNRAECLYNLGKIGLAVNVDAGANGEKFPPAVVSLPEVPPERRLSWLAAILPYLEEQPGQTSPWKSLAESIDFTKPRDAPANLPMATTNVRRFLCRSHPGYDLRGAAGLTHYVGIAGLGADAAALPVTDPRAGFFGYDRVITPEKITAGVGGTLLALETTDHNGPWIAGGPPTVRGVDPSESRYIGTGRPFGGCHRNGPVELVTAAYADASVRFITSSIDVGVFRSSARIADVAPDK